MLGCAYPGCEKLDGHGAIHGVWSAAVMDYVPLPPHDEIEALRVYRDRLRARERQQRPRFRRTHAQQHPERVAGCEICDARIDAQARLAEMRRTPDYRMNDRRGFPRAVPLPAIGQQVQKLDAAIAAFTEEHGRAPRFGELRDYPSQNGYPARADHKPTTEQIRELWMKRMPFSNTPEKIESELGFEEWLDDVRAGRA
jgi:hypothetical protein